MLKRTLILSSGLALNLMGAAFNPAMADEPQLNQDRLQQQIRDRSAIQAQQPAMGQQMRQEHHEHTYQNRDERRSENRQGNRSSEMGQGGMGGGAGGGMGGGGRGGR